MNLKKIVNGASSYRVGAWELHQQPTNMSRESKKLRSSGKSTFTWVRIRLLFEKRVQLSFVIQKRSFIFYMSTRRRQKNFFLLHFLCCWAAFPPSFLTFFCCCVKILTNLCIGQYKKDRRFDSNDLCNSFSLNLLLKIHKKINFQVDFSPMSKDDGD